jgi:DDE superfamily endonuclease
MPCRSPVKKGALKPHLVRYGLTPPKDEPWAAKIAAICTLYGETPALAEEGERVVSTDELTGVQALERQHPGLPLAPGTVEHREVAYIRHGTCSFILSRDVATGQVVAPACGPTRTEADFLAQVQAVVASEPSATRWPFVVDNLAIHRSSSLVRDVAAQSQLASDLGEKGQRGGLANRQLRAAVLSDSTHRIVFHDTPKHTSRLNQLEIWLSILVRKLLKRGSFTSGEDLRHKVLAFIDYDNRTLAKPFTWTDQGKALVA